jgi:6-pyruvoyltetrahydropterin/6-carboxytetrahydropterin synthase
MFYYIGIITSFSSSHQLRGYNGNCERLHGHNWKVEVIVKGEKLNPIGILIDFRELRKMVNSIISRLDHNHLNEIFPFTEENPSSENIARYIYTELEKELHKEGYNNIYIHRVKIYETEHSFCIYGE